MKIDISYDWNYSRHYNNHPTEIIIHHMAGYGDVFDVDRIHKNNGWNGVGYHYIVEQNGVVYAGRPPAEIGAHCKGHNNNTIGICFEGNFETNKTMPDSQFKSGVELITFLIDTWNITKISQHKDYNATACPGRYFPLDKMLEYVDSELNKKGAENMEEKKYPHEYSKDARDWSINTGLITGNGSDYGWTNYLTKEQLITILYRYNKKYIDKT